MADRIPMTPGGFEQLKKQLDHLKYEERSHAEKRLGEARDQGDLSENAEYDAAREELWQLDRRILELEDQLGRAEVVTSKRVNKDEVAFGARVKVKDVKTKEIEEYTLCGEGESTPSENKIAITTPIGQGLLGHRVGQIAEVKVPMGTLRYEILEIHYE